VPDVVPPADIVIHGDAPGLDRFVDRVADAMLLPRVVFPVGVPGAFVRDRGHGMQGTVVRAMRDAADFMYAAADPIARDKAMVRCAAARMARNYKVRVIGIIAPWSTSKGTRRTLDFAVEARLDTYEISGDLIPPDAWPVEDAGPHAG
jgi:hypothetical protein